MSLTPKVLVIDDDLDDIVFYFEAFKEKEFQFDLAFQQNPEVALSYLEQLSDDQLPHLIVCDLNMPKINGFEVALQIKGAERLKNICFVICSNSSLPFHKQKALDSGADAYFIKPVYFKQYVELIDNIIEQCLSEKDLALKEKISTTMLRKIKIVLVEDNDDERFFMKEGFTQSGLYEVVAEAENGSQVLKLFQHPFFSFDVVISDLNMPVKNGYEVIEDIKTNRFLAHIPVVILTTAPLVPYAEKCKRMGACAYYTKPDTFLQYKDFAGKIYNDIVQHCLKRIG